MIKIASMSIFLLSCSVDKAQVVAFTCLRLTSKCRVFNVRPISFGRISGLAMNASEKEEYFRTKKYQSEKLLDWAFTRSSSTLEEKRSYEVKSTNEQENTITSDSSSTYMRLQESKASPNRGQSPTGKKHIDKRTYKENPTVTPTALAHTLWRSVLRPGVDSAIDATCGNGHDALAIAGILFDKEMHPHDITCESPSSALLCIDLQKCAVARTTALLTEHLGESLVDKCVKVKRCSHQPLPANILKSVDSVGLICYNLGWLPGSGSPESKKIATQLGSTLPSIADAALLLRVGGVLSVMTYPGTCEDEAGAVQAFAEGLAMLTTRQPGGWEEGVNSLPDSIREVVRESMQKVKDNGDKKQTWRVFDHRPLGRPMSPILVTAMRIK